MIPKGTLVEWTEITSAGFVYQSSPIQLAQKGERLIEESGMKKIIDNNIKEFIEKLEATNPKTALDVEEISFYVLKEIEDTDKIIPIKEYLFNNPNITLIRILFLGSIYLRNKYFEKHQEYIKKL